MRSVSRLGPPTRITFTWGETMATLLLDRADLVERRGERVGPGTDRHRADPGAHPVQELLQPGVGAGGVGQVVQQIAVAGQARRAAERVAAQVVVDQEGGEQQRVAKAGQRRCDHAPARGLQMIARAQRGQHLLARLQLHMVALAVVKTNGLDPGKALQRPGQADGGILTTRKQNEGVALAHGDNLRQAKTTQPRKRGCAAGPSIVLQAMVTAIMASKNIMMPPTIGSTTGM